MFWFDSYIEKAALQPFGSLFQCHLLQKQIQLCRLTTLSKVAVFELRGRLGLNE